MKICALVRPSYAILLLACLALHPLYAGVRPLSGKKGPPHTYIVVIGVSGTKEPWIAPLLSPEPEARAIFETLTDEHVGFASASTARLLIGADATRQNILDAITHFHNLLQDDDVLLIYWSGHSILSPDHEQLYIVPYDVSRLSSTNLSHDSFSGLLSLTQDILPTGASPNADLVFIGDGCNMGDVLYDRVKQRFPRVSILSSSKPDEVSIDESHFTLALQHALTSPTSDVDGDGLISVEEAFVSLYPQVVSTAFSRQHPTVSGDRIHRVMLARSALPEDVLRFSEPLPPDILDSTSVVINGTPVSINNSRSDSTQLVFLGAPDGIVGKGMTYISTAKRQYYYWREEQVLTKFESPYNNSHAVIVAIDDYDRLRDPQHRGKTGYEARGYMVQGAENLRAALQHLGFPDRNIIPLYNENATSTNIEKVLETFWKGGERESADRLFFYFGGHGDTFDGAGILITYDFDKARPTLSGFLMRDLATRHAENIRAHHLLVTLDACSSGLAIYRKLGNLNSKASDLQKFRQLSIIRNDTVPIARNFLVAGTEDQPAIWDNGGIFTRALVAGLEGEADLNRDRLIQFQELATYVSDEVAKEASVRGVRQQVQSYMLDTLGTGKMIFVEGGSLPK